MCSGVMRAALLAVMVMTVLPAGALLAQSPPATAAVDGPTVSDLQALNFYIQQNDLASTMAELRRLRAEFPAWVPPDDPGQLAVTQPSTEVDTIYRQIAAGQQAAARSTLTATQAAFPEWQPPAELLTLLETAEAQVQLDAALDAGDADRALTIAAGTPDLLRCDKINNAWRIAKAQELQQQTQAAVDTYRAVISACTSYADITASLEKSASAASDEGLTSLFDLALSRFPANAADLGSLKTRLMEGRGTVAPIPEPAIRIEAQPDATMRPKARVPQVAAPEPRSAPPAAVSSGVGSSSGCLASTNGATSAARQVQRGWCAYDLDRPMEALAAFKEAESRLSGSQKRDARFGMALSYLKLNMTEEASRIAATTELTAKQRVDTESIILDQRGVRAFQKKQYRQAIGYFDALEQISGRLRRDLALLRGYAYLNTGNRSKAQELFRTLHNQLATTESRNALAASQ